MNITGRLLEGVDAAALRTMPWPCCGVDKGVASQAAGLWMLALLLLRKRAWGNPLSLWAIYYPVDLPARIAVGWGGMKFLKCSRKSLESRSHCEFPNYYLSYQIILSCCCQSFLCSETSHVPFLKPNHFCFIPVTSNFTNVWGIQFFLLQHPLS